MKTSSDLGQSVMFALLLAFSSVGVILLMTFVGN